MVDLQSRTYQFDIAEFIDNTNTCVFRSDDGSIFQKFAPKKLG